MCQHIIGDTLSEDRDNGKGTVVVNTIIKASQVVIPAQ